jgi:flavodoxin
MMDKIKKIAGVQVLFLLSLVGVLGFMMASSEAEEKREKVPDILIIYSTGTPFNWEVVTSNRNRSDKEMQELDAISTPTPPIENCKSIAVKLGRALQSQKLKIRLKEVSEITHRSEILNARMVILGSPAYFGNVSWKMKKLFDEQFHKIYLLEKGRLAKRRVAAFSMAEIEPSANAALKAIKAVVSDCRGRFGPTKVFLTKHSGKEVKKRIKKFAKELIDSLNRD